MKIDLYQKKIYVILDVMKGLNQVSSPLRYTREPNDLSVFFIISSILENHLANKYARE